MSKSKRGKTASKNLAVKQMIETITKRFEKVSFDDRKELFIELEKWARKELGEAQQDIFLTALYKAPITQDIQITIGLDKALDRINPSGKGKD